MSRATVIHEAQQWLGTPFHHQARIKGQGVDCANLLIAVFSATGHVPPLDPGYYPPDWHLHRDKPRFLEALLNYADPLPEGEVPLPGDIAMFDYGRHAAHGAVVEAWPVVIHAWSDAGEVVRSEADRGSLGERLQGVYRVKGMD